MSTKPNNETIDCINELVIGYCILNPESTTQEANIRIKTVYLINQ